MDKIKDLLTEEYLLKRGWLNNHMSIYRDPSIIVSIYENRKFNYWLGVKWDYGMSDNIPFINFIPIDPSLTGVAEHMPKGNVYIRTLEEFEVLERIIQYVPEDY